MDKKKLGIGLVGATVAGLAGMGHMTANVQPQSKTSNNVLLSQESNKLASNEAVVINGTGTLTLRNNQGEVIGYVSVGQMLHISNANREGYFVTVQETGQQGWIAKDNAQLIISGVNDKIVKENAEGQIINVTTDVHLRQEATMDSKILAELTNGTQVEILGKQGQWYFVNVNGQVGRVYEAYVGVMSRNGKVTSIPPVYLNPTSGKVEQVNNNIVPVPLKHNFDNKIIKSSDLNPQINSQGVNNEGENNTPVVNHNENKTEPVVNHENGETPVSNHFQHLINGNNNDNKTQPVINHETGKTTPNKVTPENHETGKTTPNKVTPENHEGGKTQPVINHETGKTIPSNVTPEHHEGKVTPENNGQGKQLTPEQNNNQPIHIGGKVENPNPQITPGEIVPVPEHHDNKVTPVQPEHHDNKVTPEHHDNKVPNKVTPENHEGGKSTPNKVTPVQPEHHDNKVPNKVTPEHHENKVTPEHHDDVVPNKVTPEHHDNKVQPEHKTTPEHHDNKVTPVQPEHHSVKPNNTTPEHHDNVVPEHHENNQPIHKGSKDTPSKTTPVQPEHHDNIVPEHHDNQPIHKGSENTPEHHDNKVTPEHHENNNKPIHKGSEDTPEHHDKEIRGKLPQGGAKVGPNKEQDQPIHKGSENTPEHHENTQPVRPHREVTPEHHENTQPVQPHHEVTPNKVNPVQPEHHKEVKPVQPAHKTVVEPAPTITANNVTINANHKFNDDMLGAKATVDGQPVKTTITGNVNTKVPGTYDLTITATNSQGKSSSKVVKVTVDDVAPTLIAHNYTMTVGGSFSISDLGVQATSAEGQNLTNQVKIVDSQYSTTTPGVYTLTLQVTDYYGETATTTVTLTVKAPQLTISPAQPITIRAGQEIQMNKFIGMANQPNCTYKIVGNYNTNEPGTYHVELQATDQYGTTAETPLTIIVVPNTSAPKINANSITITQGQSFDNSMLKATVNEKNCQITYSGNVNTNKVGVYDVTITATNQEGQSSTDTVTVTVKAKPEQQKQGFQWVDQNAGIGNYKGQPVYTANSSSFEQIINQALFNDINQFREANGLKAFEWNGDLATMAQWKSNDCVKHNYFTHKDIQGQYTNQVFSNQYKWGSWCENLAQTGLTCDYQGNLTFSTKEQLQETAEAIFQAWKASPGHRANMLSNNTYGAVYVEYNPNSVNTIITTMEAGSLGQTFNIQTLQNDPTPLPAHFTNPGPNVFIAKENEGANTNRHEIASKSNVQILDNHRLVVNNNNSKNPNKFSVKLGQGNN